MRKVPIVVLIAAVALNALVLSLELSVESSLEIKKDMNISKWYKIFLRSNKIYTSESIFK